MPVVLASIFRDSMDYVDRYFNQRAELERVLGDHVQLVIAEGDSVDGTYEALQSRISPDDILLKVDHGGPKYRSVDNPDRWSRIAMVCNAVMDAIPEDVPVCYIESDLIWDPIVPLTLLDDLEKFPAVAPMSMHCGRFYDIWGHRGLDGERFSMYPPYHESINGDPFVEIGSAGSCVVMRPDVAKIARFGDLDCIVGLGRDIRFNAKASLWLDTRVAVEHP